MKGNLLQLDMEKDFLAPFRQRKTPNARYIGLGKTLDAGVHFAALTPNPDYDPADPLFNARDAALKKDKPSSE